MAVPSLFRRVAIDDVWVCANCALRLSRVQPQKGRRSIGTKYLAKKSQAEEKWQVQAKETREGHKQSTLSLLEERGLVHQIAGDRNTLDNLMTSKRVGAYVGIDPTASSLHVGHLLPFMVIFWLYVRGYHAVTLLGGATSKIGDPTDRLTARQEQKATIRTANMVNMHYQLKRIWQNVEQYGRRHGYEWEWSWHRELVNNNAWMNKLSIMEVLQLLGPGIRMGAMLSRDTVKNKMEKGDGMSYAEFTYPLLQAWDWWHMYQTKGIQMQIGGADQFGNIITGIDAVKYISTHHPDPNERSPKDDPSIAPCGLTVPLLTASSGEKFGKSAGNAIWLDKEMTSVLDLYNFFMRQSDADVGRFLKLFTFVPTAQIDAVMKEHMEAPQLRKAQSLLAAEVVELVHGRGEALNARTTHQNLYSRSKSPSIPNAPSVESNRSINYKAHPMENQVVLNNAPTFNIKLPRNLVYTKSIGRILYAAGLAESASEGHRLATANSVYIGARPGQRDAMDDGAVAFTPIKAWKVEDTSKFLVNGDLLILRRGKANIRIVKVIDDEEWAATGMKYNGETGSAPTSPRTSKPDSGSIPGL